MKRRKVNLYYAHELTWPEVLEAAERKDCVNTWEGYILCSQDRKLDGKRSENEYWRSVAVAISRGGEVPDHIRAAYEQRIQSNGIKPDHARRAAWEPPYSGGETPKEEPPVTEDQRPVNKKNKKFTWSPSAIGDFDTCPNQYGAKRYFCTYPFEETEAMRWGTYVHKALELRVGEGKPLPEELTKYEQLCRILAGAQGETFVEQQLAIDQNMQFVSWFAEQAWGRVVIDYLNVNHEKKTANIIDYKSGKPKDDLLQLQICAVVVAHKYPEIETFKCNYTWLKELPDAKKALTGATYTRDQIPQIWGDIYTKIQRMEQAWVHENFTPRESGLCRGWCHVEDCIYWKEKR